MKAPEPIIEIRGANKAAVDLHALGERGADLRRVSEKVRTIYRRSNEHRFDTGGAGQWPSLKPSTVARKAKQGLDPRPLRGKTGALYRSLTSPRALGQIDRRDRSEFRFGTTIPYAGYHAYGKGRMHRDLIELTAGERQQIVKLIRGYIARAEA